MLRGKKRNGNKMRRSSFCFHQLHFWFCAFAVSFLLFPIYSMISQASMQFSVTLIFFGLQRKTALIRQYISVNLFLLHFLNTIIFTFHHSSGWERQFPMFNFYIYQFRVKNRRVQTNVKHSKERINGALFDMSARCEHFAPHFD